MGFLNSYKRLDNLCRDMNGIGVTGYIKDMECLARGTYFVPGWKEDYFQLKQYRHIRNRIAHENDINENDLCSAEDAAWLETFYQRILTQNDPLALYYKYKTTKQRTSNVTSPPEQQPSGSDLPTSKHKQIPIGCATLILSTIAIVAGIIFYSL